MQRLHGCDIRHIHNTKKGNQCSGKKKGTSKGLRNKKDTTNAVTKEELVDLKELEKKKFNFYVGRKISYLKSSEKVVPPKQTSEEESSTHEDNNGGDHVLPENKNDQHKGNETNNDDDELGSHGDKFEDHDGVVPEETNGYNDTKINDVSVDISAHDSEVDSEDEDNDGGNNGKDGDDARDYVSSDDGTNSQNGNKLGDNYNAVDGDDYEGKKADGDTDDSDETRSIVSSDHSIIDDDDILPIVNVECAESEAETEDDETKEVEPFQSLNIN